MLEARPKAALTKLARALMLGFVVQRHEEHFTHGVPDISVTGLKRTSWWEVKLANPDFNSKGIQELTMLRLAAVGFAWHIIYAMEKDESNKRVFIVEPSKLREWESSPLWARGHNHQYVVEFMLRVHGNV